MARDRRQPRGPRWCNAHAIQDEHYREVFNIMATAQATVLRCAARIMSEMRRAA